ncbi:hypothetical protein PBT90_09975 [Algoriphagus halophytocola]|uniref:Lipoprotein n=1 Tax=Algoriphagus halophytocola TaxID=2991499 RepID=A0ABY6MIW4_9BACT|nr:MULTISPECIES: hypothetical protein [unclassified Algoriphagus]UZD23715.1 hypothetical protein OM944_04305 [Algoriphagus sp. TR-M5]WBL45009.1 hypothetical protein PBT90_09975 [Algoriphagus sp. TR-M9]
MKYQLVLFLFCFLLFQSCQDESPLNVEEFYYDQTACSDPWISSSSSTQGELIEAVEDYLLAEGIKGARVISITDEGGQQDCEACFCTTGNRINVAVSLGQRSKMEQLGFK